MEWHLTTQTCEVLMQLSTGRPRKHVKWKAPTAYTVGFYWHKTSRLSTSAACSRSTLCWAGAGETGDCFMGDCSVLRGHWEELNCTLYRDQMVKFTCTLKPQNLLQQQQNHWKFRHSGRPQSCLLQSHPLICKQELHNEAPSLVLFWGMTDSSWGRVPHCREQDGGQGFCTVLTDAEGMKQ